jgi:co-chaperonin GroES (HSP10)
MFDIDLSNMNTNKEIKYLTEKASSLKSVIDYNAFYIAVVVSTQDSMNIGRVKIRIPAIHGVSNTEACYLADDELPWAKPACLNGAGNDMGSYIIPQVGSRVFVTFEYNNSNSPIYFGGVVTKLGNSKTYNDNPKVYSGVKQNIKTNDIISEVENNQGMQVIFKSFKGNTVECDDSDGNEKIRIIDASGQFIELGVNNSENAALPRRGDNLDSTNPDRYILIKSGNNCIIKLSDGKVEINSNDIEINGTKYKNTLEIYPIGSYYYTSDSNFNPSTSFGGTWVKITGVTMPYTCIIWHRTV